jgi:signal transduction histidine kinase
LKFDDCDLAEIVRQTIESYSAEGAFYGVQIQVATPTALPGKCDRGVLEQIVINLVSNALKYGITNRSK